MQILAQIRERFFEALDGWVADPAKYASLVTAARDPRHGDYQANIAMPLKKVLDLPPREIAQQLAERVRIDDLCEPPEIAGPGFINLRLHRHFLTDSLSEQFVSQELSDSVVTPQTYVIDYSSPNVAKPMHVGHIRTTVIGDSLAKILRELGHKVITDNHLGDWGTQFGMIIYGYKHFVDKAAYDSAPVAELSRLYRLVQQVIGYQAAQSQWISVEEAVIVAQERLAAAEALPEDDKARKKKLKVATKELAAAREKQSAVRAQIEKVRQSDQLQKIATEHPNLETRAQQETAKLHEGDPENIALWKQFVPISITEIESVYDRLDVRFDYTYGESFYHPMLAETVQNLIERGQATESDGAICLFLDGFDAPMIIRKRDGAYLYATTDMATIDYRMKHFEPDAILYVVDHRQSEHFEKLFAAARACGHTAVELQHISFGTVLGADGKPFKTRSGDVTGLEYLLDQAVERAYEVVCNPDRLQKAGLEMSEQQRREVAQTVGIGAIKYADLSHNRTSDYEFNIEKMVQLEGNTSAYIQYMYARTRSILRKSGESIDADNVAQYKLLLQDDAERSLALSLLQYEDALHQSIEEYYPSVLAGYVYGVARQFASFFDKCPVLAAENESVKRSRLAICFGTGRVLKQGLELLGIGVVERM